MLKDTNIPWQTTRDDSHFAHSISLKAARRSSTNILTSIDLPHVGVCLAGPWGEVIERVKIPKLTEYHLHQRGPLNLLILSITTLYFRHCFVLTAPRKRVSPALYWMRIYAHGLSTMTSCYGSPWGSLSAQRGASITWLVLHSILHSHFINTHQRTSWHNSP